MKTTTIKKGSKGCFAHLPAPGCLRGLWRHCSVPHKCCKGEKESKLRNSRQFECLLYANHRCVRKRFSQTFPRPKRFATCNAPLLLRLISYCFLLTPPAHEARWPGKLRSYSWAAFRSCFMLNSWSVSKHHKSRRACLVSNRTRTIPSKPKLHTFRSDAWGRWELFRIFFQLKLPPAPSWHFPFFLFFTFICSA